MTRNGPFPGSATLFAAATALSVATWVGCGQSGAPASVLDLAPQDVTFNKHVAPIVFEHCATCHRPGESAPFSLLTYEDVKQHAEQIVEVTASRFMPPWLPEPGYGEFEHERLLSDEQMAAFARWVEGGASEGDPADLPQPPVWAEGWQLGEPDLVVTMPEEYTLPVEGQDVFRNFVIPIPVEQTRYVRGVELQPGNKQIVHHAIMRIDREGKVRWQDEQDPGPGFGGMEMGLSQPPDGHFLGWTPGKVPFECAEEMAWRLEPGTDLVLQLHMLPTGKPEVIRPRIGLFFSKRPPVRHPVTFVLRCDDIDIPAGEKNYVLEDSFETPVELEVAGIYPHAHFLGKVIEAFATLPDGSRRWLVNIKDWDFNWQDDYRYAEPVVVPKGSTLHARFVFDNSEENVRNPSQPPRRVVAGNQSTDEMATMTLQLMPRNAEDRELLREAISLRALRRRPNNWYAYNNLATTYWNRGMHEQAAENLRRSLELNPEFIDARVNLGKVLCAMKDYEGAAAELKQVLVERPEFAEAHQALGVVYSEQGELEQAVEQFERVLEIRPEGSQVHYHLANVLKKQGNLDAAAEHLERAVAADPEYGDAHYLLAAVRLEQQQLGTAGKHLREALRIDPENAEAHFLFGHLRQQQGNVPEAVAEYERAVALRPDHVQAHHRLGFLREREGRFDEAVGHYRVVLEHAPDTLSVANSLALILATSGRAELRNGAEALVWAKRCAKATDHRQPGVLITLAAAEAEVGNFDEAVRWQTKATELLPETAKPRLQPVLELYRAGKPLRRNDQ